MRIRPVLGPLCFTFTVALTACDKGADTGGGAATAGRGDEPGERDGPKPEKAATGAEKIDPKRDGAASGNPGSQGGEYAFALPQGIFDAPKVPPENPMSAAKVELGHALFMDKRLSGDGSRSCYSCHQNELGNADGRKTALGAGDKPLSRNSPTIWNVGLMPELYWDGRAPSLEKQAIGAWKGGNMGVGDGLDAKAAEIGQLPEYAKQFAEAFGLEAGAQVKPEHIAMALSSYERTLLCGDTAYDKNELEDAAKRGLDLFKGKASCTTCHAGDNLSDAKFHNVGVGFDAKGKPGEDLGRGKVTNDDADKFRFRTPTLRNVARTAPYFHDGSVESLEEAVKYMAGGGNGNAPGLDENLVNRELSDDEIADLVAFLQSLDCPGELEVIGDQEVAGIPK